MYEEISVKLISVTEPVGKAIERTKAILFSPFDLGKWFTIGFCAWLAFMGEGGGFNPTGGNGCNNFGDIGHYIQSNLYWIIPVGLGVSVLAIGMVLVLAWLRSRGKFMFLDCVARNKAEVSNPWNEYAAESNSLFVFKIVFGLISLVCYIPLAIGWFAVVVPLLNSERLIIASIGMILVLSLLTLSLTIAVAIVAKFTDHFVVPTMYLHRIRCMEAWKRFWELLKDNIGHFILFALFLLVLNLAAGALIFALVVGTCGCACCFLAIPFIGTVVKLPIYVFMRSYSAYYLAQYGREWDVFIPPAPPQQPQTAPSPSADPNPLITPDEFFRGQI
jgi:hypothetical protein